MKIIGTFEVVKESLYAARYKGENMNEISKMLINESKKGDSWLKAAEWRQKNEYWLRVSQDIAIKILGYLRAKNMSQKDLAARLDFSPQHVSKILKGSENLTIESICRIEKALQIKLIDTSGVQETKEDVVIDLN